MNKSMTVAMTAAFALALSATAFAQNTQPNVDESQAGPTASTETANPAISTQPPASPTAPASTAAALGAAGKGHIVFFRPTRLSGAFYTYHIVEVGDDGKPAENAPHLGDLANGAAFAVDIEPGIHSYNITGPLAVNKAEDRLRIEVEPGETYYVEQTVRVGLLTSGFRLAPADEARFTQSHVKLK